MREGADNCNNRLYFLVYELGTHGSSTMVKSQCRSTCKFAMAAL